MPEPAAQPLLASAIRAVHQLRDLGDPLPAEVTARLAGLTSAAEIDALLRPHVLVEVSVDEHAGTLTRPGAAPPRLVQHGWTSFLIRVANPHRIEGRLNGSTPGVYGVIDHHSHSARIALPDTVDSVPRIEKAWLQTRLATSGELSGLEAEYHVISAYSRDAGARSARLAFTLAVEDRPPSLTRPAGNQAGVHMMMSATEYGATLEFDSRPAREIRLDVREPDGASSMAAVTVRDAHGRSYPSTAMRLAPDMFFHEHVYRATGEVVVLPDGEYEISVRRGPEYREATRDVRVEPGTDAVELRLDRWVDPAARGYYSGDPHIHAGGCSHYNVPSEGVTPETMIRHVRGEGLWLGSVLTWGPCYYHQKQFFSGESISPPALLENEAMQQAQGMTWSPRPTDRDDESALRYDVEVSGFPSSHSGHVILLGLTDQDYPGTRLIEDWPSWNLPIMRWGQAQGALTGYAHCGLGLDAGTDELPNHVVPRFQSIGSNEIIVDVPLGSADFQAGAEVAPAAELNVWYHLLNVGYRTLMLGETDYPCIYDDGPGVGRTYVRLPSPPRGPKALEAWLDGLRAGASYFGDGRSHVFDLAVDGDDAREQRRASTGPVRVTATVAAWLPETPPPPPEPGRPAYSAPVGWHLERARVDGGREVLLELVVNGYAVASRRVLADGAEREVAFDVTLERSSWVALRILPSVHTQPIFVEAGGRPIRASKRSAQWLHDSVDALWTAKSGFIRPDERDEARAAYDQAQATYLGRLDECEVD